MKSRYGRLSFVGGALLACLVFGRPLVARADLLIYKHKALTREIVLQGEVTVNAGRTVTLKHPIENMTFSLEDVEHKKAPTIQAQFSRRLGKAKKDPEKLYAVATWALRHGMLDKFYEGIDRVLKAAPSHEEALRIKKLKEEMDRPLPDADNARLEALLKKFCPMKKMKILTSKHFMLLHDTGDKPVKSSGKGKKARVSRATARLELLERVYESFLLTFFSRGIDDLQVPKERMMVVLFDKNQDYKTFSIQQDKSLVHASGYWSPVNNISVFFDHASSPYLKELADLGKDITKLGKDGGDKNIIRLGKTLNVLARIEQASSDVEVVSHEGTHQVAGNTGLFPRDVLTPQWMHEGLATYFECPNDVEWGGIGAVNQQRLDAYREASSAIPDMDFVVGDKVFKYSRSLERVLWAYGTAWAFTHFMMTEHLQEFIDFYRKLGELPPDSFLSADLLVKTFQTVIPDLPALMVEWQTYMSGLRTDRELIMADESIDEDE